MYVHVQMLLIPFSDTFSIVEKEHRELQQNSSKVKSLRVRRKLVRD